MFGTLVMADSITNYATVSGFIVGLGVLLFVVRARRLRGTKTATSSREDKDRKLNMILAAGPFKGRESVSLSSNFFLVYSCNRTSSQSHSTTFTKQPYRKKIVFTSFAVFPIGDVIYISDIYYDKPMGS
jgi:hypothetical protein